ncbi:MAG TPA: GNAT family N-acetyltransferase [Caulobacteraceae bacterium]|jgi:GNAT superfamily N-acetyltransferase|nr:GNAT family N-acetyltransferase [Caulobacteraceae bacterium]
MRTMQIVEYRPELAGAFKALNEAWITRFFAIEAKDREVLDDPAGKVIAPGGRILFAMADDRPVGCVALMPLADGGFEVAKMAVEEGHTGLGLGRALMAACVEGARAAGAPRLYLETNSALSPALGLYRSFGFQDLTGMSRGPDDYARVDVWMELKL